ncbi:MAG: M14 metallopeptidase family protein [Vicinamibacterales bacterium]
MQRHGIPHRRLSVTTTVLAISILLTPPVPGAPPRQAAIERPPAVARTTLAPATSLGWEPCADYKLATYEQLADYFRALDAVTDRMQVSTIGTTAEGRAQLMAVISSDANMAVLPRWKAISQRLARARELTPEAARSLAAQGKAVVWIDFGLQANEVAHAQVAPLLAWMLVTDDRPEIQFIRDNVVVVLVPSMNPDGTTMTSEWYRSQLGGRYESSELPWLNHKYAGHDNNRDWFMFNLPESQNVARQLYVEWLPQIVYDHHQPGLFPARIFIPPFREPTNPHIPAGVRQGIADIGAAMAGRFAAEGKSGVISNVLYDSWWNGGMRSAPAFHNMIGILTETAHASASPATYEANRFPRTFPNGLSATTPSPEYPNPWKGGVWRMRDSCDYMMTASLAVLEAAAKRREHWLSGIYQMGRAAIAAGGSSAFVIDARQWDDTSAVKLVNALRHGGVEVERTLRPFAAGGRTYTTGSYIVREAQPFGGYVRDLLMPQRYPDVVGRDGQLERPYDITGWTLSYQMGVNVDRVSLPQVAAVPVTVATSGPSRLVGTEALQVLDPRVNESFRAVNRLLRAGIRVERSATSLQFQDTTLPPGAFIVSGASALPHIADLGLTVRTTTRVPASRRQALLPARVGLYRAWGGNEDEGWTRWVLEQFEFPYQPLDDQAIRGGRLRSTFDVIVLPDASYEEMRTGLAPGTLPDRYTGGMTAAGVANLAAFVAEGGTLVTLGRASDLPILGFRLPVRNVTAGLSDSQFLVPGSLLRLDVDPAHPVALGSPASLPAFFSHGPAFDVSADTRSSPAVREAGTGDVQITAIARYPRTGVLMSGWMAGESYLKGLAAALDVRVGRGHVVMFGFRPQHRGQTHGTFRLLFNAIFSESPTSRWP